MKSHRRNPRRRRRSTRRNPRRGGSGFGRLGLGSIKGLFSRDNIYTAAGVVAGASITAIVVKKWGDKLPMLKNADGTVNTTGAIAYSVLIPGITGILLRKYNRAVSDGLILAGLVAGARTAIDAYVPDETKASLGFSEYLTRPMVRGLSAPLNGAGGRVFNRGSILASASPFKASNW